MIVIVTDKKKFFDKAIKEAEKNFGYVLVHSEESVTSDKRTKYMASMGTLQDKLNYEEKRRGKDNSS